MRLKDVAPPEVGNVHGARRVPAVGGMLWQIRLSRQADLLGTGSYLSHRHSPTALALSGWCVRTDTRACASAVSAISAL